MKLKHIKKIFNSVVLIVDIIAVVFLLLSAFSDRISPNTMMFFAYAGLIFPIILLINIFFVVWWLLLKKWKFLLINIIALLICSNVIFTYFPMNLRTKEVPEDCIKVLTYNTMRFDHYKKHNNKSHNGVIAYILDVDADIVCLQEYGIAKSKYLISQQDIDNIFKEKYPYRKHVIINKFSDTEGGIAIYSKFPINSVKKIPYTSKYNGSCIAELDVKGKKVTLINNHLESNRMSSIDLGEYVGLLQGIKDLDSEKVENITEMTKRRLSVSYKTRALQVGMIAESVKNVDTPYIIVCGDFNDTPISYTRRKIMGDILDDAYVETGFGPGITYNRNRFWLMLEIKSFR